MRGAGWIRDGRRGRRCVAFEILSYALQLLALLTWVQDIMQRVFIPNWSSGVFEAFVRRIGGLVNKYGGYYDEDSWEWKECETAWRQVLWAETHFWPDMGGS